MMSEGTLLFANEAEVWDLPCEQEEDQEENRRLSSARARARYARTLFLGGPL